MPVPVRIGQQKLREGSGEHLMAKRRRSPKSQGSAPAKPVSRWSRPGIKHTSIYLPEAAHEALREVAFAERRKIHDVVIEGIGMALKKRGYALIGEPKPKLQGKAR
jgi:hypothetical protein